MKNCWAKAAVMSAVALGVCSVGQAQQRTDRAHYERAKGMIDRGIEFLRSEQDEDTGGWSVSEEGPVFPAVTGLALTAMLGDPSISYQDDSVARGLDFLLGFVQDDGGIYDRVLPSYNTSICLSALAAAQMPESEGVIDRAEAFLRSLQWSEDSLALDGEPAGVGEDHPYYGGLGYGKHGRPDGSNLHFFMQAMEDAGVDCNDEPVKRALVYLERLQMDDSVNDMAYADGSSQGGFVYATSENKDTVGEGETKAGTIEETLDDGTTVSRLRAYGSMTYAGFKSYAFAQLGKDDPRVVSARAWIERHYTLEENPGVGDEGRYYYYLTFAKALDAWGEDRLDVLDEHGDRREAAWAEELIDALGSLQNEEGSFRSVNARWMEDDAVLITSFAIIALQKAID